MKKSNGSKVVLIRRTGASPPKADNTIGMYTRDGQGGYSTKEQAKTAKVDETLAKRLIIRAKEKAAEVRNPNAHPKDPADNIRHALRKNPRGKKFLRKRVLGNSFDPTLDERESPVVAATIKQGEQNVAKDKETRRKATHAAMVKRLIAARGTKPKKPLGIWKGKTNEGTNARERGEVQSPRSQDEYDALSPENKKIVDKRTQNARAQSMLPNPNSSPPRPSNPQRRNKARQRDERARRRQNQEYIPDHGESLGEVVSKAVKTDRRAKTTQELKKRHPNDSEARAGAGGKHRKSGKNGSRSL